MAKLRVSSTPLGTTIAILGLLAHIGLADVSHVATRAYLPPRQDNSNEVVYKIVHEYAQTLNNNRNYLPPLEHKANQPSVNYLPARDMRAPPNYYGEQQFSGSAYLPPQQNFVSSQQHSSFGTNKASGHQSTLVRQIEIPTYLPPGYDYKNPQYENPPKNDQPNVETTYWPPKHDQQKVQNTYLPPKHDQPNVQPMVAYQLAVDLPAGYDFVKPAGAEEAIAELHTLPDYDNAVEGRRAQNSGFRVQEPTTGYLPPQMGKLRTVQILNSLSVKTLRVLETEHNGVRHIKILGHTNDIPSGEHYVVKIEAPGSNGHTVKVFSNHQPQVVKGEYSNGNLPINTYLPPQASHVSYKRSVRVSGESYQTSF